MPLPLIIFFYGGAALVVLLMAFTYGVALERHRRRSHFHTDDELQAAEHESYQRGLQHGYARATHALKAAPVHTAHYQNSRR